jgi:hypothetical protein
MTMNCVSVNFTRSTTASAFALFGLLLGSAGIVRAADVSCENGPMVKNMRAYSSRCAGTPAPEPHQLTKKEVKRLTLTAKSAQDHLTIAHYYEAEADRLDSLGAGYEEAAAGYRHNPTAKNLMSPTTAAHYDYLAKGFREEAKSDRTLAASQEQMAKQAVATTELPRASASVTQ